MFAQKAAVKKVRERQSLPSSNLISLLVGFGEHESIELLEVPFPPPEAQLPAENSISRCLPMPEAFTARCVLSMSRTRPRQMSEAIKLKLRDEILPDAFDNKKLIFPRPLARWNLHFHHRCRWRWKNSISPGRSWGVKGVILPRSRNNLISAAREKADWNWFSVRSRAQTVSGCDSLPRAPASSLFMALISDRTSGKSASMAIDED